MSADSRFDGRGKDSFSLSIIPSTSNNSLAALAKSLLHSDRNRFLILWLCSDWVGIKEDTLSTIAWNSLGLSLYWGDARNDLLINAILQQQQECKNRADFWKRFCIAFEISQDSLLFLIIFEPTHSLKIRISWWIRSREIVLISGQYPNLIVHDRTIRIIVLEKEGRPSHRSSYSTRLSLSPDVISESQKQDNEIFSPKRVVEDRLYYQYDSGIEYRQSRDSYYESAEERVTEETYPCAECR